MHVPGPTVCVRHEHEFALEHIDELILLRMCVTSRRLAARQDPNEIDPIILQPRMVSEAPIVPLALSLPERLGITECVALRHIARLDPLVIVVSFTNH